MKLSEKFSKLSGPLFVLASAVVWSFSGVLSKGLEWSGVSKAGVRGVIAIFIYAIFRRSFKVKFSLPLIVGALGVALTSVLYMTALSYTTSGNAIVLQYSMPIFVVFLSWLMFKQKPRARDVLATVCVLAGVVLCFAQGARGGAIGGDLIALCSGLTYACVFLSSRIPNSDPLSYTYLGNCFSALMAVYMFFDPAVHFVATAEIPASAIWGDWIRALLMGLSLGFGYLLFAYGIRRTSPVTAAILSNVEPVLNPIWVFIFIGENPGVFGIIGAAVVLITVTVYSCIPNRRSTEV